jgi:hypothetical protein
LITCSVASCVRQAASLDEDIRVKREVASIGDRELHVIGDIRVDACLAGQRGRETVHLRVDRPASVAEVVVPEQLRMRLRIGAEGVPVVDRVDRHGHRRITYDRTVRPVHEKREHIVELTVDELVVLV